MTDIVNDVQTVPPCLRLSAKKASPPIARKEEFEPYRTVILQSSFHDNEHAG